MFAKDLITLPREMDEDLWYIVGGALGAESPEQCSRASPLWKKLVDRADRDAKRRNSNIEVNAQLIDLAAKMKEFISLQADNDKDDWYVSSQGAADCILTNFAEFLGINLEE